MLDQHRQLISDLRNFNEFYIWLTHGIARSSELAAPYHAYVTHRLKAQSFERVVYGDNNKIVVENVFDGWSLAFQAPEWARELDDHADNFTAAKQVPTVKDAIEFLKNRADSVFARS